MTSWANNSLRDAIECLARAGRTDLASDLDRIHEVTDLSEREIFRCSEVEGIVDALVEIDTLTDLNDILHPMTTALGVEHCTLHIVREATANFFHTQVLTTYPQEWISRYVEAGFQTIDPVMAACQENTSGFYWDSLDTSAPVVATFMREARRHGVGPAGFTSITRTDTGDVFGVSVSSSEDADTFRKRFDGMLEDYAELSCWLSEAFLATSGSRDNDFVRPSTDQLRVLRGIAEGMEWEDLEAMEMCYGSFRTVAKSICSMFNSTTLMQAAVQAVRLGLIDTAPLSKQNVFSTSSDAQPSHISRSSNVASLRRYARRERAGTLPLVLSARDPAPLRQMAEEAGERIDESNPV